MLARSRTWGEAGLAELTLSLGEALAAGERLGVTVALAPAAGDVVGDAQRFAALRRRLGPRGAARLGAVLVMGLVIDASMRDRAADHLARFEEGLGRSLLGVLREGE